MPGGALMSKDELLTRVWSGVIVEENNLHAQISVLRRALGADRDLIRTVSRRGYRFADDVIAATEPASAAQVGPEPVVPPSNNLPIQFGELIGREADLPRVVELQTNYRLLTLTGSGGIGKVRHGSPNPSWPGLSRPSPCSRRRAELLLSQIRCR